MPSEVSPTESPHTSGVSGREWEKQQCGFLNGRSCAAPALTATMHSNAQQTSQELLLESINSTPDDSLLMLSPKEVVICRGQGVQGSHEEGVHACDQDPLHLCETLLPDAGQAITVPQPVHACLLNTFSFNTRLRHANLLTWLACFLQVMKTIQ